MKAEGWLTYNLELRCGVEATKGEPVILVGTADR